MVFSAAPDSKVPSLSSIPVILKFSSVPIATTVTSPRHQPSLPKPVEQKAEIDIAASG